MRVFFYIIIIYDIADTILEFGKKVLQINKKYKILKLNLFILQKEFQM